MVIKRLNVSIIGAGAVSEILHLPALTKLPSVCIYSLVDKNKQRADEMAHRFCLNRVLTNYEEVYDETDIALVALPNHLHAKITSDFLENNVNVLCEKPMATTVSDCQIMIDAAQKSKAKLMIGHNKRFMSNVAFAKKLIDAGSLGNIMEYQCNVGAKFKWPTQSGFYFKKGEAGGGVLIDMGVHIIDMFLWFFGDIANLRYSAKDLMGKGVEDNVSISFVHKNSVKGHLTLSRTEVLENKMLVKGTHGWLKIDIFDATFLEFESKRSKASSNFGKLNVKTKGNDTYRDQIAHFVECINSDKEPLITGEDGMKVIEVVQRCYQQAK
jgi:predicted dehydrogenase